jgi:acetyltransferase-like isoleucine patch superfamily enzyme
VLSADKASSITIEEKVVLEEGIRIFVLEESAVAIETETTIGMKSRMRSQYNSIIQIGKRIVISPVSICSANIGKILLEKNSTFGEYLVMGCHKSCIQIGEDNMFSKCIEIYVGNHKLVDKTTGMERTKLKPIRTGKHVWVGAGATLLSNCDIGDGAVVGASALVNSRIPEYSTCAGNPAKVLRNNIQWER